MLLKTTVALFAGSAAAIWPLPASVETGDKALWINENVPFIAPWGLHGINDTIVKTAIDETKTTIFEQGFVPWKFHQRNTEFAPKSAGQIKHVKLVIDNNHGWHHGQHGYHGYHGPPGYGHRDEGNGKGSNGSDSTQEGAYSLDITENGQVTVTSNTAIGLRYGLNTFSQLFYQTYDGKLYMETAPVHIKDSPKFEYRGVMLDVARSFYPVKDILRQIDGLAYNKMNKLHLHITDSQSWPLELPSLPEISAKGAYAPHLVYTPADYEHIQAYGQARGVDVITEIDMPGHIASLYYSHPEVIGGFGIHPYSKAALEPGPGVLNYDEPAATDLIEKILADVLPRVKSDYYHAGGDEVLLNAFLYDPTLKTNDPAILQPIMQKYVDRVHEEVRKHGKTPFAWHDTILQWNLTLGKDVIIQSWDKNSVSLVATLKAGHRAIVSPGDEWYLDCGQGAWIEFPEGTYSASSKFLDYCSPKKSWRFMYSYNPLEGTTAENEHLVIGGEANMWTEMTDGVSVDTAVWPRAAVVGEVLWSGNYVDGKLRDLIPVSQRLAEMRERLATKGINAEALHMPYCTQDQRQCYVN